MKKINAIIFIVSFILSACSSNVARGPAHVDSVMIQDVFIIKTSKAVKGEEDLQKLALDRMKKDDLIKIELVPYKNMPADRAFVLDMDVDEAGKFYQTIYYGPDAFKDKAAVYNLINFSQNLTQLGGAQKIEPFYEMYYNAQKGHAPSLQYFLNLKNSPISPFAQVRVNEFSSKEYLERVAMSAPLKEEIDSAVKKFRATQRAENKARKEAIKDLDKLPEDQQLRALIASGNRKGAADLIKKYLPWEMMAPFEKKYWQTYLDVMENPAPLEERVLIYRGIDDDFVYTASLGGRKYSREEAIREGKAFFMSTILVKNQGSWNRRLRSLETMYDKFIGKLWGQVEMSESMRMAAMFNAHSGKAEGSPFLSFTPNLKIAANFGEKRVSSYLVDPRLLSYNYLGISGEAEFLMALTTFPDELVGIFDHSTDNILQGADLDTIRDALDKKFVSVIENEYGTFESPAILEKIKKNSYNFFLKKHKGRIDPALENVLPGPSNLKFYNGLKQNAVKPLLGPTGNLNCSDMVPLFWKYLKN